MAPQNSLLSSYNLLHNPPSNGANAATTSSATPSTSAANEGPPAKKCKGYGSLKKGRREKHKSKTLLPGEVNPADVLPASKLAPPPTDVLVAARKKSKYILGIPPSDVPASADNPISEQSQIFLGCATTGKFLQLVEYLRLNGDYRPIQVQCWGACQFASFRRGIDCPMEYTNTHLWRQLVMELVKHKEFFFPTLEGHIAMVYGGLRLSTEEYRAKCKDGTITKDERHAYEDPGPFLYRTYLEYLLNRTTWGDEITLVLLGMLFQVRITLIDTGSLLSTQVRHTNNLEDVDIVMLFANGNHYMPAGKDSKCFIVGLSLFDSFFTLEVYTCVLSCF